MIFFMKLSLKTLALLSRPSERRKGLLSFSYIWARRDKGGGSLGMGSGPIWRAIPSSSSPDLGVPFVRLQITPGRGLSTGPNSSLGLASSPGSRPKVSFSRAHVGSASYPPSPSSTCGSFCQPFCRERMGVAGAQQDTSGAHRLHPAPPMWGPLPLWFDSPTVPKR